MGTVFHCHHGYGVTFLRVASVEKGRQLTLHNTGAAGEVFLTMHLMSEAADRTCIRRLWWWPEPADERAAAFTRQVIRGVAAAGDEAMLTAFK